MSRAVRTGRIDARDRATKRRRDRPSSDDAAEPNWIAVLAERPSRWGHDCGLDELGCVDLAEFLAATSDLDIEPAERLRQLAIAMEDCVHGRTGWAALDRVYEEADRLSPGDVDITTSRGLSACELASAETDAPVPRELFAHAHRFLAAAEELAPTTGFVLQQRGYAFCLDPLHGSEEALPYFERALECEPGRPWSLLYRAYCLHDLERYRDAIRAYESVPKDAFSGPKRWRVKTLQEQVAHCYLMLGERETALAAFERLLAQYERDPSLCAWVTSRYRDAAREAFPQLAERFAAVERESQRL